MTDPFEVLPAEVYLHIASFVEVGDVPSLARVSRVWHGVVEQDAFWRSLYLRRFVYRHGAHLQAPPFARQPAWPVARRPVRSAKGEDDDSDHDGDDDGNDDAGYVGASDVRERAHKQAVALMKADAVEREADERRLEEDEMARIRRDLPAGTLHVWRTCYQRRLRMMEGVCLVFMVGSNSLPYAADVVDKLYAHGIKVNSTCIIQQPYDGSGPHKGWEEELVDHLKHHSVVLFFANIAGGDQAVRATIGNHMADFVDAGGSVVLLAFATCNVGESPGGRWAKDNYFPIALDGQTSLHVELGPESEGRDHHLLTGVRRAFVSYHGVGQAHAKAKVMGRWSDKTPAMARLKAKKGTIIAVNFFPPSSDIGDGGWAANGRGWMGREDNSSAQAWMQQFLDRLTVVRYQTGEGDDVTGGDDTVPEAAVASAADSDDAIEDLLGGGMAIPPELTTLLRSVSQEDNPWGTLIARIDGDADAPQDQGGEPKQQRDEGEAEEEEEEENEEKVEGKEEEKTAKSGIRDDDDFRNDVMVMLANAVKYGLWKASRLEPRKGFAYDSSPQGRHEEHLPPQLATGGE